MNAIAVRLSRALGALALAAVCGAAWAQSGKTIKVVAPYPPGGPTDIMARVISQQLTTALGEQVIVDNRPGAGGVIGAEYAAKSPADGNTLLMASASTIAMAPHLYPKLGYSPSDFAPVGLFADAPFMIVVHPSVQANTVKEFIALAKAKPGQLSYGSAGVGNILHISGELFKHLTGTDILHVPYKGGAQARADLIAGRIQVMFEQYATFQADIPAHKVKVLAVASLSKHPLLPEVPTADQVGLPDYVASAWFGLVVPKGTPNASIARLNGGLQKALASKEVTSLLLKLAFVPRGGSAEQFGELMQSEIAKWGKIIKTANIKAE